MRRITHPCAGILLLVVCGTIANCDDHDHIAAGSDQCLFCRPEFNANSQRDNSINATLLSAGFTAWVCGTWPDRPGFVAIDGKTMGRSHDRAAGTEPTNLVSTFATPARLMLTAHELIAIPVLLARLAEQDGLHAALVSIDATATDGTLARAVRAAAPTTSSRSKPTNASARRSRSLLRNGAARS